MRPVSSIGAWQVALAGGGGRSANSGRVQKCGKIPAIGYLEKFLVNDFLGPAVSCIHRGCAAARPFCVVAHVPSAVTIRSGSRTYLALVNLGDHAVDDGSSRNRPVADRDPVLGLPQAGFPSGLAPVGDNRTPADPDRRICQNHRKARAKQAPEADQVGEPECRKIFAPHAIRTGLVGHAVPVCRVL